VVVQFELDPFALSLRQARGTGCVSTASGVDTAQADTAASCLSARASLVVGGQEIGVLGVRVEMSDVLSFRCFGFDDL
jgi:hypothetical protein